MINNALYLVCGQCGTLNAVKGPVDTRITAAQCSGCSHEIPLAPHLLGPESGYDRERLFGRSEVGFAKLARRALHERIRVVCDSCNSKMKVGKRLMGRLVKCPSCSAEIHVPYPDAEDQFDISLLIAATRKETPTQAEVVEMDESDYEEKFPRMS